MAQISTMMMLNPWRTLELPPRMSGELRSHSCSFPAATSEPVTVTAPMNTPMKISILCRRGEAL